MQRWAAVLLICCSAARAENVLALPFFNHTGSTNLDWIGESISETVRDALVSEGVLALDREDRLEGYRRLSLSPGAELTHASILKTGDLLDASLVIYGSYELLPAETAKAQSRGSLRITARIIDLKRMRQGQAFRETGAVEDLATLEFRLGWQTLQQLEWKNVPSEEEFLKARPAVRLDAMESFARGLVASTAEQRHLFFTRAARLDGHYSQPCFQLGKIYWDKKDYKIAAGWLARVTRSDPHYFEAQFFLGLCHYNTGDFAAAAQCFELVAETVPLNEVYNDLGAAQARHKDSSQAIANFRKALEGDSADPDYHFNLGYTLWRSGDYAAAVESLRAVVERNPSDAEATALLGRALKKEGPRPGDPRTEARERIKINYEETAYRQLRAELGK
ncbi:MAG: tetratricopeptide repeat protein [Bryobacteraceae bacterium]